MSQSDGLEAFDGFTRQAAADGMFNDAQLSYMRHLSSIPREAKCRCGWREKWDCYYCNHDDFRRRGIVHDECVARYWYDPSFYHGEVSPLAYRLPNGVMTGYRGAVAWLRRRDEY